MKPSNLKKCPECGKANCNHGSWDFTYHNTCLICGEPMQFDTISFGFGSVYDMNKICMSCSDEYGIDNFIKSIIEGRPNKG